MATSPFQTAGNVGDIAPVSLKGGFTPSTGVADAVTNVVNTVVPLITKNLEDNITSDVTGKIQAVSEALKATRFPSIQKSMFSKEALENPNVKMALKEFTLIQDAASHGRLPATFALERLEIIQNNAIRLSPEFEQEIRGAMQDATGQDPTKTLFSQLISTSSKKQTAQEKLQEQLIIGAGKIGVTVDEFIGMNQVKAQGDIQLQAFDLSAKQGSYTLNTMGAEVANRGAVAVTGIMNKMMELNTSGTPISPDVENQLIALTTAAFGNASAALQSKSAGLNVSGTAIAAAMAPLREQRDQTIAMIKDGTLAKLLKQNSAVIIAEAQNTWLNHPEYGKIYAVTGSQGFLNFMDFRAKFGNNPAAEQLLLTINKDAAGLYEVDKIMKQASKIGDDDDALSKAEEQARVLAAAAGMANVEAGEEYQMKSLADVQKYKGQEVAWSIFANRDMINSVNKSTQMRAAFINIQVATTAGLSQDLVQLAAQPEADLSTLTMNSAGQLTFSPPEVTKNTRGQVGAASVATAETLAFLKRFNRANNISAMYNGAGLLPAARYGGSEMYWGEVRKAADEIVNGRKEKVNERKVIIGSDGKLVFDGGT